MKRIIQIYEVQTPSEAEALIALGVDHIGSVLLSENTWRVNAVRDTVRSVTSTSARSCLIPLFSRLDVICRVVDYYRPHILHFCEALTSGSGAVLDALIRLQKDVKERFPELKIMRSVPIRESGSDTHIASLEIARKFQSVSDFFLTDTVIGKEGLSDMTDQPVEGFVGITGRTCDWQMARKLVDANAIPVIVAGGISPDNVGDAIVQIRPAGVDSCTLTNAVDHRGRPVRFKKDLEKVKRMIEEVRKAEIELKEHNRDA